LVIAHLYLFYKGYDDIGERADLFNPYDKSKGNAETERVIRTIKKKGIWPNEFLSFEEAKEKVRHWINLDYNKGSSFQAGLP